MHVQMYIYFKFKELPFCKEQYHDIRVSFLYDIRNNAFSHDLPLRRSVIVFYQNTHKAE